MQAQAYDLLQALPLHSRSSAPRPQIRLGRAADVPWCCIPLVPQLAKLVWRCSHTL